MGRQRPCLCFFRQAQDLRISIRFKFYVHVQPCMNSIMHAPNAACLAGEGPPTTALQEEERIAAAMVHSFEAVDREIMTRCRLEGTKGGATGLVVLRVGARCSVRQHAEIVLHLLTRFCNCSSFRPLCMMSTGITSLKISIIGCNLNSLDKCANGGPLHTVCPLCYRAQPWLSFSNTLDGAHFCRVTSPSCRQPAVCCTLR